MIFIYAGSVLGKSHYQWVSGSSIKMALNDTLGNALSAILNDEKKGKAICKVKPAASMIKEVLRIIHENNYLGSFSIVPDNRGNSIEINLLGKINKCGVIKPR